MDKYLEYQEEQINNFLNSSLAKELFDLVKINALFKIKIDSGPIFENKYGLYCLSISLTDLDDNSIYVFDDGYLTAYVELVRIRSDNNEIFCCKRGPGKSLEGFWEFPGGKVELHETHERTIVREIKEELLSDIEPIKYICVSNYEYKDLDKPFSITMFAYECKLIKGELRLTEHTAKKWVKQEDLIKDEFAPADRPIIDLLKK